MAPFSLPFDAHAGFIKANDWRFSYLLLDCHFYRLQSIAKGKIGIYQSTLAQTMIEEVNESLSQSIKWHKLILI